MSIDSYQSVYRERLIEHLLIGELLKHSWLHHGASLEVSQPSIDRSGHDVVLEANGITRHVQLKTSTLTAKTSKQKVHIGLEGKASGCVVWVRFNADTMKFESFLFFGGAPGQPLPAMDALKVAKHTKGDSKGVKKERPNIRLVPVSRFRKIGDVSELYAELFGVSPSPKTRSRPDAENPGGLLHIWNKRSQLN